LRGEPLSARRAALERVVPKGAKGARGAKGAKGAKLFPSHRLVRNGLAAFNLAKRKGYEGVVAKDESAPYVEGRSGKWVKFKVHQEESS
jgi:ATP-dependent DNA ligase